MHCYCEVTACCSHLRSIIFLWQTAPLKHHNSNVMLFIDCLAYWSLFMVSGFLMMERKPFSINLTLLQFCFIFFDTGESLWRQRLSLGLHLMIHHHLIKKDLLIQAGRRQLKDMPLGQLSTILAHFYQRCAPCSCHP